MPETMESAPTQAPSAEAAPTTPVEAPLSVEDNHTLQELGEISKDNFIDVEAENQKGEKVVVNTKEAQKAIPGKLKTREEFLASFTDAGVGQQFER